jgi:phage terminase large subunit
MLQNECRDPRDIQLGITSIWQKPVISGRYVMGVDTAWGMTGSYSCASILDWATGTQVAEMHGRPHPDEAAREIMRLHLAYNHAYMGLEIAGEGQERDGESVVVVNKVLPLLAECGCRNKLFYADHTSSKPEKPGWQTDGKTRPVMLGELAEAVRNREIVIRSAAGVSELMSFVRNEKGRPQHVEGAYDDRVMSYAIAWQMRKYARFSSMRSGRSSTVPLLREF